MDWFNNSEDREQNMQKGNFTINLLRSVYEDLFYNKPITKTREPSIEHYEWEEDGQKYSSWKIDTGSAVIWTGDAGKELFDKALKEQINGK